LINNRGGAPETANGEENPNASLSGNSSDPTSGYIDHASGANDADMSNTTNTNDDTADLANSQSVVYGDSPLTTETNEIGNTAGNINIGGYFAQQGDWIYYTNGQALHKRRTDGSEKTLLTGYCNSYINVVGEWVYFSTGYLSRIRTDGTGESRLTDMNNDQYINGQYITVVSDWIYYRNENDNYSIYKIRTDGSENTKLNDESIHYINVEDGWIYYTNTNDGCIYRIRTDGGDRTKLSDFSVGDLQVIDGWMYGSAPNEIFKMRIDGSERTKIRDIGNSGYFAVFNVSGKWIFYCTNEGVLFRINADGSDKIQLSEDTIWNVHVLGDWLYYTIDNNAYRIRIDGTDWQLFD